MVYHIYPRSFQDTDGDGIGDIPGIISHLDYLQDLGVDLIMLGPVYPSPDDDNGYDVADFRAIDPKYGTMEQWRELVRRLHDRGMRIMMDLVLNHTSDEHPWFVQARSSKDSPYRDYYYWRRPSASGNGSPNNWQSVFSGPAWEWDAGTGEYYLHLYSRKQPDLDWSNPEVRRDVADILTFWAGEGVDAFRLDSITTISKPAGLPDAPVSIPGPLQPADQLIFNGPDTLGYLRELRDAIQTDRDILLVAEGPGVGVADALEYLRGPRNPVDLILQWEHIDADPGSGGKWNDEWWTPKIFAETMTRWQKSLDGVGWNALYLSNHDQARQVSRFGDDMEWWSESAKMLATAAYFLQGTPFIYQGEEIGMTNVDFERIDEFRDIESINKAAELRESGMSDAAILSVLKRKSRDNGRTPMQWDSSPEAGFTTGHPWIGVNSNHTRINVADQMRDPSSILSYYRELIRLRKETEVIQRGDYELVHADEHVYAYARKLDSTSLYVISNFTSEARGFDLAGLPGFLRGTRLIGNYPPPSPEGAGRLRPYECVVILTTVQESSGLPSSRKGG